MKYCTNCGKELDDQVNICPECGTNLAVTLNKQAYTNTTGTASNGGYSSARASLSTNRSLLKFILLNIVTFGIYGIVILSGISTSINTIAQPYDGRKTMHYCLVTFVFSWLTVGILPLIWYNNLSNRVGNELQRRGIAYSIGAKTFWGWAFFGSMIIVGPFIYYNRLLKAMNLLCGAYNAEG